MKVLIACEESQAITIEMRKLWIEAYSCDIQECSWSHPERHIQWDAIEEAYSWKYEMMIAHPPCTYLSNAWATHLYKWWVLNQERFEKWMEWAVFFQKLLDAPIKHIAIENPVQSKCFWLRKYDQVIEPYFFWDAHKKKTCLWIKNLPFLEKTNEVKPKPVWYFKSWPKAWKPYYFTDGAKWGKNRAKNRSKTFPWIAKAIAEQRWVLLKIKNKDYDMREGLILK